MARVVISPDSLKGSATAADAANAIGDGWRQVRPGDELILIPQADGGEGTLDALAAANPASVVHTVPVTGPDGRPVAARWLELPGRQAVVELAESSGLPLMAAPAPLTATTRGLGEVIRAALTSGVTSLTIGLGGSASTDGGAGALAALGLRLLDSTGAECTDGGAALVDLAELDTAALPPVPAGGVRLLTDVTNPLLGPTGAAAVFGPQKGARPDDVERLEAGLARFAALADGRPDEPGAGAAGGTAYGFAALWGARIVPGAPAVAELSGLTRALAGADVVISGEGRFDETSFGGKVVGNVLRSLPRQVRAMVIAGRVDAFAVLPDGRVADTFGLVDLAPSAAEALADPLRWLRLAGAEAASRYSTPPWSPPPA
ncbi:MAG TPA: glycerate kinase [Naasia sp.]